MDDKHFDFGKIINMMFPVIMAVIAFQGSTFLHNAFAGHLNEKINLLLSMSIAGLAGMVFVASTISYVVSQRKKKCECSRSTERNVVFGFAILQAVIIVSALAGYGILQKWKKV